MSKKKIVLTGGPSGGKTTALSILKETFGSKIEIVQEAATLIYSGGFPRKDGSSAHVEAAQHIIFYTVHQLEHLADVTSNAQLIVCDRGSIDGAVYWPHGPEDFFKAMGSSLEAELARYDAVLHLSPPPQKDFYQSTNVRTETLEQALEVDRKILKIWEKHPNRVIVPGKEHYFEKAEIIKNFVEKLLQ
ncbi:MAG: ATP-binding protein [Elusimicrobiaceae bacterium]|nr:ATP-binding protein [Elusimicrobiaceae bacterium]